MPRRLLLGVVLSLFAGCPPQGGVVPPANPKTPEPLPMLEQAKVLDLPTAWLSSIDVDDVQDVGLFGFLPVRATSTGSSVRLELLARVGQVVLEQNCPGGGGNCSLSARWKYRWRSLCLDVRGREVTLDVSASCVVPDPADSASADWSLVMDDSTPLTPASQWIRAHIGFPNLERPDLDWFRSPKTGDGTDRVDDYAERWPPVAYLQPTRRFRLGAVRRLGENRLHPSVWRLEDAEEGIGFTLDTGRVRHLWTLERDGQRVAQYLTHEGDVFELSDVRRFGATERHVATSLGGPRVRPVLAARGASETIILTALEDEEARVAALERHKNVENSDLNVLQYRLAVAFRPSVEGEAYATPQPTPVFAWATSLRNVLVCFNTAFEQWPGLSIEGLSGIEVLGSHATTALPQCAAVSVRGLVSGVGARLVLKGLPSRPGAPARQVEISVRPSPAPEGLGHELVYRSTLAWRNPTMAWRPLGKGASYAAAAGFAYVDTGEGPVSEFRLANGAGGVPFPESMVALSGTAWIWSGSSSFFALSRDMVRGFTLGGEGEYASRVLPMVDGSLVAITSGGEAVRLLPYGGTQALFLPFEPAAIRGGFFDEPGLLVAVDGGHARYAFDGGLTPLAGLDPPPSPNRLTYVVHRGGTTLYRCSDVFANPCLQWNAGRDSDGGLWFGSARLDDSGLTQHQFTTKEPYTFVHVDGDDVNFYEVTSGLPASGGSYLRAPLSRLMEEAHVGP